MSYELGNKELREMTEMLRREADVKNNHDQLSEKTPIRSQNENSKEK